jgi:chromosome partitioning protein
MEAVLSDESQLWRLYEARAAADFPPPIHKSRPRILLIANNKGGVGKTNLAVLLAAYFEKKRNFKVLLIDLDNQASLTAWMLHAAGILVPPEHSHRLGFANKLLDGTAGQQWHTEVLTNAHVPGRFTKAQLATADVTLTEHETRLMLRFFAQGGKPDVRYHIAETLLSEHVQGKPAEKATFDLVIIDAPPRLTTGVVGALIASTHLLVPTKLDALSAETVEGFLRQAWAIREKFNTGLELAGVVGTMTPAQPLNKSLGPNELEAVGIVQTGLQQWGADTHYFARDVQERAAIKHAAGREVAYFQDDTVRDMIDALGDELCGRIGL